MHRSLALTVAGSTSDERLLPPHRVRQRGGLVAPPLVESSRLVEDPVKLLVLFFFGPIALLLTLTAVAQMSVGFTVLALIMWAGCVTLWKS